MSENAMPNDAVLCRAEGALGHITLNRPSALNALTAAMRLEISDALAAWQKDPMIYAIVIDAEGDGAFCAGGDLHEIHRMAQDNPTEARAMAAAEYAFFWQIDCYTKPIVSLIDGICMGAGVGLTAYGTHRVAGLSYAFAMPETAIGFFPDAGATLLLGQLENKAGLYLGLSGRMINRTDAFRLGLVSHCIPASHFEEIRAALRDAEPLDALLDDRAEDPDQQPSEHDWDTVANLCNASTLTELMNRLHAADKPFAAELAVELNQKSPLSLAVTFKQLTDTTPADLSEALRREYRQAVHALQSHEFREGTRALLIDKDNKPQWQFSSIEEVPGREVQAYFERPSDGELELPARPKAIAAIV